jgi:hypothetical protein
MGDQVPASVGQLNGSQSSKLEMWVGVLKLLIGSVFATVITTVASCHLKSIEFNQTDKNLERDFLSKHFDYITDPKNKDNRLLLAQYCATVFGGRWADYKKELEEENKRTLEEASKTKEDLVKEKKQAEAASSPGEHGAAEAKQAAIDIKLANVQQRLVEAQMARNAAGLAPVAQTAAITTSPANSPPPQVQGWCYAGKYTATNGWQDATLQQLPKDGKINPGMELVTATPLYLRTAPRTEKSTAPGPEQGAMLTGAILKVLDVRSFADRNSIWLNVEVRNAAGYYVAVSPGTE